MFGEQTFAQLRTGLTNHRLTSRVQSASVGSHTHTASAVSHWSNHGPLVAGGVVVLNSIQALLPVEPTNNVDLV